MESPQQTLLTAPLWRAEDLGKQLPPTKHGTSMCLPRWQDVVGYEEKAHETMAALTCGYPRFFYHPLVAKTFAQASLPAQIYSTEAAAKRCRDFLLTEFPDADITVQRIEGYPATAIRFPAECAERAKAYWQHAGEGISSRMAELILNALPLPDGDAARKTVVQRIAEFSDVPPENVYLFPTGMMAIFTAFRVATALLPNRKTVQFAFPYADTLKLQEKMGAGTRFYPRGNADELAQLERDLETENVAGLFCEFPTNPLLTCVDLPKLRELADHHAFPLIVDETLAACGNANVLKLADVSAISLTKYFSGSGDVMGGALVINPDAPFATRFIAELEKLYEPAALCTADLIRLAEVSADCRERVTQINQTAETVCHHLKNHPAVAEVYYPAFDTSGMYEKLKSPDGGYGGLFSFVLKEAAARTPAVYDALEISKGPNLGTSFSLCCPFTLLAHYHELDWAEAAGASRWLIRIAVGLEPAEKLIVRLDQSIAATYNWDTAE